jgi:hypothetical protein
LTARVAIMATMVPRAKPRPDWGEEGGAFIGG